MKKFIHILAFWILWTMILFICIGCLFGISLLDGAWSWYCMLGAVTSAILLSLLMADRNKVA